LELGHGHFTDATRPVATEEALVSSE
jgi:hypothetical protein